MCSALGIQRLTGLVPAPKGATLIGWPLALPVLPSEDRALQRNETETELCRDCRETESSVVEEIKRGTEKQGGNRKAKCPLSMHLGKSYQKPLKAQALSSPNSLKLRCLRGGQGSGQGHVEALFFTCSWKVSLVPPPQSCPASQSHSHL